MLLWLMLVYAKGVVADRFFSIGARFLGTYLPDFEFL